MSYVTFIYLTELWVARTVYRVKLVLVIVYTHFILGVVLRGILVGLVISLLMKFSDLEDLSNRA